jgi:hypothetical protein
VTKKVVGVFVRFSCATSAIYYEILAYQGKGLYKLKIVKYEIKIALWLEME